MSRLADSGGVGGEVPCVAEIGGLAVIGGAGGDGLKTAVLGGLAVICGSRGDGYKACSLFRAPVLDNATRRRFGSCLRVEMLA